MSLRRAGARIFAWITGRCVSRPGSGCARTGLRIIAAALPIEFPDDPMMRVSHETIYQSLFVQTKGELRRDLAAHLRSQRTRRKAQGGGAKRVTLGITENIRIPGCSASAGRRASTSAT